MPINLDLVYINAYAKFGQNALKNALICSQDIERKWNSDVNQTLLKIWENWHATISTKI